MTVIKLCVQGQAVAAVNPRIGIAQAGAGIVPEPEIAADGDGAASEIIVTHCGAVGEFAPVPVMNEEERIGKDVPPFTEDVEQHDAAGAGEKLQLDPGEEAKVFDALPVLFRSAGVVGIALPQPHLARQDLFMRVVIADKKDGFDEGGIGTLQRECGRRGSAQERKQDQEQSQGSGRLRTAVPPRPHGLTPDHGHCFFCVWSG